MTDDLIARLSADLKPVRRTAMQRLLIGALLVSGVVAVLAMLMLLGMRPDMETATTTMTYWTKFGYTLALALLGLAATLVLARPEGRTRWPWLAGLGLLAALLALRRMAPASPTLAGFAAGIMSGATGAWIYSFACDETGMMFLALWYTLGIVIVGGVGAVLGRFLLRW